MDDGWFYARVTAAGTITGEQLLEVMKFPRITSVYLDEQDERIEVVTYVPGDVFRATCESLAAVVLALSQARAEAYVVAVTVMTENEWVGDLVRQGISEVNAETLQQAADSWARRAR